jgi:hypothetical protein
MPVATCPVEASALSTSQEQGAPETVKLPNEQLDSLVAPIALYPDSLLAQVLVASTYPLEVIQLQQWLAKNKGLKDKALTDAVMKQDWDASIQAMAPLPDLVKILSENIKWTTDLGNAFLAQQSDVMDAVQRMRAKAKGSGQLKSTEQQKVETKVIENKTVVVIESSPTWSTFPVTTPSWSTARPYIRTTRWSIHQDMQWQAWRSRSVSASPWVRPGEAAGVTAGGAAGTTTSTSTTTTIS